MIVEIPDLLSATELTAIQTVLAQSEFIDGKLSAGSNAKDHKNNEELQQDQDSYGALNNVVMTRLVQHPVYLQSALPKHIAAPIYARYHNGMGYGYHVDDPIMGPVQSRYRSDVSITVFLNGPDDYKGGELSIRGQMGDTLVKLPAGHAVIYPSSSLHAITPVTEGQRLVAVTWVQSHVRDPQQRELLLQLHQLRNQLTDKPEALSQLDLSYANLLRMWAEN